MKRLLVGLVAVSLFAAACGGTGSGDVETSTTAAPVTAAPVTTAVPATTTPTTTVAPTTTAAPTTTTTVASAGIEVNRVGVQAGPTWVYFAYDDEEAIAAIEDVLGSPTKDTGWIDAYSSPYGVCPGPVVRGVEWDSFVALFTQADTDFWTAGVPHFFAYYYTDGDAPAGITTTEGIAIGDTLGDLEAAYPGEITVEPAWFDETVGYWSYRMATWTGMWGYADGLTPDAHITSIGGGQGCGE